ncbi:hypothetical protein PMAYCL1PPCAC_28044 [Pristionchus mayeri]|uniref:F-box domain-containing protein n=1 Tax=Pristionchus mayeri TaxID=1317129 RepID=A0AAN5D9B4_9BILA|nr:hypothetical protein PMAYCL1PPCAC_28044 [Pristionchus mayeri]
MQVTGPSESSVQQQQPDEQSQQHETATDEASFTVLPCQNPLNEDDTAGEESTPSRSSSSSSYIDFSFSCYSDIESDPEDDRSFIEAMGAWNNMETQKTHNEDALESDLPTDESEYPSWESLPRPAFDRVFSYLRTDKKCSDLASLAKVSTLFRAQVKRFMGTPGNGPTIFRATLMKTEDGLKILLVFFPSNLPFLDLSKVDWGRFERSMTSSYLEVTLNGPADPVIDQVIVFMSTTIQIVEIYDYDGWVVPSEDLSMCAQLLRGSTIDKCFIRDPMIDDISGPAIITISFPRVQEIVIQMGEDVTLSDPAAFIVQLDSLVASSVGLDDLRKLFFGLPSSFWKNFLNEKLRSNSIRYVERREGYLSTEKKIKITKAPIDLPENDISYLKWEKVKST